MRKPSSSRRSRQSGYSLIFMACTITVLFGALGLAFDLGRVFIVKSELQAYADAAALAAIYQMDGSRQGVTVANTVARSGPFGTRQPAGVYFNSSRVTNVTTEFATSLNGSYDNFTTASSPVSNNYSFLRVTTSATLPISFLPAIAGMPKNFTVTASATAGQMARSGIGSGGAPFMPDAHDASDTTGFGFVPGGEYTLKWGNGNSGSGKGKGGGSGPAETTCANDIGWPNPNPTAQHGYVDLGQGNSNSNLRDAIMFGGYPNPNSNPSSLNTGMRLDGVPGNRGTTIFDALDARVDQDTDNTSTTYAQYVAGGRGNGRRVITVPIADPSTWNGNGNGSAVVVGFANFFLGTSYSGTSGSICATYINPASSNGSTSANADTTRVYQNVLFR